MPFNPDEARGEHGRWTAGASQLSRQGAPRRALALSHVVPTGKAYGLLMGYQAAAPTLRNLDHLEMSARTRAGMNRVDLNAPDVMEQIAAVQGKIAGEKKRTLRRLPHYRGRGVIHVNDAKAGPLIGVPKVDRPALLRHELAHAVDLKREFYRHPDYVRARARDIAALQKLPLDQMFDKPSYVFSDPKEGIAEQYRSMTEPAHSRGVDRRMLGSAKDVLSATPQSSRIARMLFRAARLLKSDDMALRPETLEYLQKRRAGIAPRLGPARTPGMRMRRLGRSRLFLAKALLAKDMDAGDVHISSAIGNDQPRRRGRKYPNIAFARMPNVRKPVQLFGR